MVNIFNQAFKAFKKNFVSTNNPKTTKYGLKSDSSKQADFKINTKILKDYFLSDPLIRQSLQTNVDNICNDFYFEKKEDSQEAEDQVKRAEELFYRDNFMEKWRNLQLCLEIYDDAYQEVQTYIKDGKIVFDSFVLETPSITILNKQTGGVDKYIQKFDGKVVAKIDPENIIHYRFNAFGDRDYGLSLVSAVLYSSAIRKFIEKYNASIFQNHKPRGVWTFPGDMPEDLYNLNVDLIIEGKNDPNKDLFLRGTNIDYKNFLDQKDVDFIQGYIEARNEIIIGLGVPPIMLGLPEGSNLANSDVQLQSYDRRVQAKQNSFAYKINNELITKLGFDKIKFKITKTSKRDEERELNILNKMVSVITLNEARKELGYPPLDPAEYPEADKIWTKTSSNPNPLLQPVPMQKSVQKEKKKLKSPEVSLKTEEKVIKPFQEFYDKLISETKKEVNNLTKQGKFKKSPTTDSILGKLQGMFDNSGLDLTFATFVQSQYLNVGNKIAKNFGKKFKPNKEELDFLKSYNLDMVKAQGQRELSKIKQILDVGLMNNQSSITIKQALDQVRETAINYTQTLVRTELNRANNMGSLNSMKATAKTSKKYLVMVDDNRTSPISRALHRKYGTEEQAIPLEAEFTTIVDGKRISGQAPPFHPNDRDTLVYTL